MSQIVLLSKLNETQADQAVAVCVESFYEQSKLISKDKRKLHAIFKAILDYNQVYVFVRDGRALGFLGLGTENSHTAKPDRNIMQQHLGRIWGAAVAHFMNYGQPKAEGPDQAVIEYLAVDPDTRGQGIGGQLIQHVLDTLPHRVFFLETTLENTAVKLYNKKGFQQIKKKIPLLLRAFAPMLGLGTPIYMWLEKEEL